MSDLVLSALRKSYPGTIAVEGLDLTIAQGEMVAFLGPSGCGKTTTLRMVAGFITPTAGSISMKGRDITALPPNKRDMGMVFQSYALFPHMTVAQNIMFGLKCKKIPGEDAAKRLDSVLGMTGLTALKDRYPKQMSGGQQQRVALARVLALQPELLLFDEPLSNLDAKLRVQMRHDIRRLQKDVGITSLFVTHDQEEAMTIADRIVVMNKGRIEQEGSPREIYDHPATRFVADFIGTANLFEGEAGSGQFRTAAGLTLEVGALAPATGTSPALLLRPEKLHISPEGAPVDTPHLTTGRIERAVKLGGLMEYLVRLPSGESLLVHRQDRSDTGGLTEGVTATVGWRSEDARLVA